MSKARLALLVAALALFAAALYAPSLGRGDFVGDDESLDAGVVWQMAHGGGWLFPEFNGQYLPPKPPLFYWAARAASLVRGEVDEWALRAPSALAGIALVALTGVVGTSLGGIGTGALAGALLATSPVVREEARIGRCDMLLALLSVGALFGLLLAGEPRRIGRGERAWFWTLLGLATICKGGAGAGLVIAVLLVEAVVERSLARIRSLLGIEALLFLAIPLAWYGAATVHWGRRFVDEQIVGENLNRLIGGEGISDKGRGTRSLLYHVTYYPVSLFAGTLPWSLALPAALLRGLRDRTADPRNRFLTIWIGAGLLFFTVVSRKSPYYLLPLAPAVCLCVARLLMPAARDALATGELRAAVGRRMMLAAAVFAAAAWTVVRSITPRTCGTAAIAEGIGAHPVTTLLAIPLAIAGLSLLVRAARSAQLGTATAAALAITTSVFLLTARIEGPRDDCTSLRPFARKVGATPGATYFFQDPLPAVVLYSEKQIPSVRTVSDAPSGGFLLIVPESLAPEVPSAWSATAEVVHTARARVFTRRPMEIRLLRVRPPAAPTRRAARLP